MNIFGIPTKAQYQSFLRNISDTKVSENHITTFAILEGLVVDGSRSKFYKITDSDKKVLGDFYCISNGEITVAEYTDSVIDVDHFTHGIRPCIVGDNYNLVKDEFKNVRPISFFSAICYADFGEYIGDAVSYKKGRELGKAYADGLLTMLDKTFTSAVGKLPVYEYKGKKYVLYKTEKIIDTGMVIANHDLYWCDGGIFLEVKPLKFIVFDYLDMAICCSVVQAGKEVRFDFYSMELEESLLYRYLNGPFLKDILLPESKLFEQAKDLIMPEEKNADIDEVLKKIDERASELDWICELVKNYVDFLIAEYNVRLDNLKNSLQLTEGVSLTLKAPVTKESLKAELLNKLEETVNILEFHRSYYGEAFDALKSISAVHLNRKVEEGERNELIRDISTIGAIALTLEKTDEERIITKLKDLFGMFYNRIISSMKDSLVVIDGRLICRKLDVRTHEDWEFEFRKAWHPILIELNDLIESSFLKKRLSEVTKQMIDGIYNAANDNMASMYLNEMNDVVKDIRMLISKVPAESRKGILEELKVLLSVRLEGNVDEQKLLYFTKGKLLRLYRLKSDLEDYVHETDGIESFKYLSFLPKKEEQDNN